MPTRSLLAASVALAVAGAPLVAQVVARPAPRVGIMAGVNIARLSGDDDEGVDNRTAFVGGVTLTLPFTPTVSFQPELLFAQKGAKVSESGFSAEVTLNYLEVPLLLRFDVPTTGASVFPHVYAGPALGLKLSCDFEVSGGGVNASQSCASLADEDGEDVKSFDAGVVLGGGLGFDLGGRRLNIGARYNFGVYNIAPDGGGDTKNRAITIYGSLEFPMGR